MSDNPEGEPKNDSRSTAEYVKAEFGVDIEAERQNIEAECERHIALIQEMADSFGLSPSYINGETDGELIEELRKANMTNLAKSLSEDKFITIESLNSSSEPMDELDEYKTDLFINPRFMTGSPVSGYPAKEDTGRIDRYVTHMTSINQFGRGELRIVATSGEPTPEFRKYFGIPSSEYKSSYPYIVSNCWETLVVLELMEQAQNNNELREALHTIDWQKPKALENSGFPRNAISFYQQAEKEFSADTIELIDSYRKQNSPKSEKYREAIAAQARLVTAISLILVARYAYIAHKAEAGKVQGITYKGKQKDLRALVNKDREIFEVSKNYSFPEEGTREAIESEMPWLLKFMKK